MAVILCGAAIGTLGLLIFSYNRFLPVALLAMGMLGLGISIGNVATNMLLQTLAPDHLRGRVVSFFSSTRFGFDAIGGLLAGLLAAQVGVQRAMLIEGLVLATFVVWALGTRSRLRDDVVSRV